MTAHRSAEEPAMRAALTAWGRQRWPGSRVLEELNIGGCRVDLAFVQEAHIAVVEIKSSKDTLDRLERQLRDFTDHLPEVWLATAPRWIDALHKSDGHFALLHTDVGHVVVADGVVNETIAYEHWQAPHTAKVDYLLTVPLLHVAHLIELKNMAAAKGLAFRERATRRDMMQLLARRLTGDEIVAGVCGQIRARPRNWPGDAPIEAAA